MVGRGPSKGGARETAVTTREVQGLIAEPFKVDRDGYVQVPDGSGLGVEAGDRWQKVAP